MNLLFTCLFAAILYFGVHCMRQDGVLPEDATVGCNFFIIATSAAWYRIISISQDGEW